MITFIQTDHKNLRWNLFVLQCGKFRWASGSKPLSLDRSYIRNFKTGNSKFLGVDPLLRYYSRIEAVQDSYILDLSLKLEKIKI